MSLVISPRIAAIESTILGRTARTARSARTVGTPARAVGRLRKLVGWILTGTSPAGVNSDEIERRAVEAMAKAIPGADDDVTAFEHNGLLLVRIPSHLSGTGEPAFHVVTPNNIVRG